MLTTAARASLDLRDMSIEELGQIQVTSVSKSAQPLSTAPAAIYVITHDDILRSGATSFPEMLRLAPNLQVAQITAQAGQLAELMEANEALAGKLAHRFEVKSVF